MNKSRMYLTYVDDYPVVVFSKEALRLFSEGHEVFEVTAKRVSHVIFHDDLLREAGFEL